MPRRATTGPAAKNAKQPLRVAVVDDREIVRLGYGQQLRILGFELTVSVARGEELLELLRGRTVVDVALIHMELEGIGGPITLTMLSRAHPELPVLALCDKIEDKETRRAMCANAKGVLLVRANAAELMRAVQVVHSGLTFVNEPLDRLIRLRLLPTRQDKGTEEEVRKPSARELEALAWRAKGHTERAVADMMDVEMDTVHSFMKKLYAKWQVHSVAEATHFALKKGWLPS